MRLESVDIRARIVFLFLFAVFLAVSRGWLTLLFGFLAILLLSILYRADIIDSFKKIALAEKFLLLVVLFLPFTYPGTPLLRIGPLSLTQDGLTNALLIFARSSIILLGSAVLLRSADPFTILYGLYGLYLPPKLVEIAFFALRYISVIDSEYRKLKKAMKARGFKPKANFHTYRSYAYLMGMLFARSYNRAERVYRAMLARGFNGRMPLYRKFKLSRVDLYFITSTVSFIFLLTIFEWR
ncbi:MAG: cobalt ECF transporter T component CbiQ [Synergistetes bacterium]|nr:MAG: Cobalt ABC transporter, inner membrane subunit CbiQ [bacterium 42_11]MBC7330819.1 cobalt ECF transporter T component CbiQ [Synergistota bacterium]